MPFKEGGYYTISIMSIDESTTTIYNEDCPELQCRKIMRPANIYQEAINNIPLEVQKETELTFAVSDRIHQLMTKQGITQKGLAKKMGKTETEISLWLSGQHNFTLKTLARISAVLGEDLIRVN